MAKVLGHNIVTQQELDDFEQKITAEMAKIRVEVKKALRLSQINLAILGVCLVAVIGLAVSSHI